MIFETRKVILTSKLYIINILFFQTISNAGISLKIFNTNWYFNVCLDIHFIAESKNTNIYRKKADKDILKSSVKYIESSEM